MVDFIATQEPISEVSTQKLERNEKKDVQMQDESKGIHCVNDLAVDSKIPPESSNVSEEGKRVLCVNERMKEKVGELIVNERVSEKRHSSELGLSLVKNGSPVEENGVFPSEDGQLVDFSVPMSTDGSAVPISIDNSAVSTPIPKNPASSVTTSNLSTEPTPIPDNTSTTPIPYNTSTTHNLPTSPIPNNTSIHSNSINHLRELHETNRRQSILFDVNYSTPSQQLLYNSSILLPESVVKKLKTENLKYTEADMIIERKRVALESKKESEEAIALQEDTIKKLESQIVFY